MSDMNVQTSAGTKPGSWNGSANNTNVTVVRLGERTLIQLAARLGVSVEELREANPQLATVDHLPTGMEVRVPVRRGAGQSQAGRSGKPSDNSPSQSSARWGESRLESVLLRSRVNSQGGSPASTPSAAPAGPTGVAGDPADSGAADPRFDAVNRALQSGNSAEAMAAARTLIASLQADKPPQVRLLNHAHMALAAASLMNNDLDAATKALRTIDRNKLDDGEKAHYDELRDLIKDARREAFSSAFDADVQAGGSPKGKGAAAAEQAAKLVEFLQATDPGNHAEIAETKLKQANALLLGGRHKEADKVLGGVDEKHLDPDQKTHLGALREELHAQWIDAFATGYDWDMKEKRYGDAVQDSTVLVNRLAAHFPDRKEHLASARLKQATAQLMNGEVENAQKTLGRISGEDLRKLPKGEQKLYQDLNGAVREHFETQKKLETLKADQAEIKKQLQTIDALATSGNKADAQKAVPMAEQLVATIREKYPDNATAIAGAKLSLANARLAAGNLAGAKTDLAAIVAATKDPAIRDQAQFLQARVALREGHTDNAVEMLQTLSTKGTTPELRQGAKAIIISVEGDYLKQIALKAKFEAKNIERVFNDKHSGNIVGQFFNQPSKPFSATEDYIDNMGYLSSLQAGATIASDLMKKNGLTLAELRKMTPGELDKRLGPQVAQDVRRAITLPDANVIAKHDFTGGHFSWENNGLYVDPSFLNSSLEIAGKWVGDQVRGARAYDEELMRSDSIAKRIVGYGSSFILDRVSDANNFIKDKLKNASDFYNDPERKDTWYAKLGRVGVFGGDMLTSVFTMPATIVDYKADDKERAGAILGTVVMAATVGAIKGGGPAWKSLGKGASRVAQSRAGQWIAQSEFGQWAGRAAGKVGDAARWANGKVEASTLGKGIDRIKAGLGKLNPTIGGGKGVPAASSSGPASTKTVDHVVDDFTRGRTAGEIRNSITAEEISAARKQFDDVWKKNHKSAPPSIPDEELRRYVLGNKIYDAHYNPSGTPKPATISQAEHEARFMSYDGPKGVSEEWLARMNKTRPGVEPNYDWMQGDVRRFYFNVKPDKAVELADYLAEKLNRRGSSFQFKTRKMVTEFNQADAGVLYVEAGNYEATKKLVLEYAKKHPEAFAEGTPAMTKPLAPGISAAHEPIQASLPVRPADRVSHGQARTDIMGEAILDAPANATQEQLRQLVRQRLQRYGIDPDRPWLKQGATRDDL